MAVKKLSVLGSTGSIGRQALSLTESLDIEITAIAGHSNIQLLEEQALRHRPAVVCAVDNDAAKQLKLKLGGSGIRVLSGKEGLLEIASNDECDTVLNAVVGIAGLEPTLASIAANKNIALANKESLVAAGELVIAKAKGKGVNILPVDSEHSAIFQCLQSSAPNRFSRIFLTASGGPFFGKTAAQLRDVTPKQALAHPTWSMGSKISIDSATMMNKGLELIEAMRLFGARPGQIEIVVHRQSVVHSMVEFADGAVLAQLSVPDMRIPIQYALTFPERRESPAGTLSLERISALTFERPDLGVFKCLNACIGAANAGGLAPAAANAANERAVELFLYGKIPFLQIGELVERFTAEAPVGGVYSLEDVLEQDRETRARVDSVLGI